MTRLAIASVILSVVACSGGHKKAAEHPTGEGVIAKKIAVSWGISQDGEMADLYLATTDETGKQISHELGRYKGACAKSTPAPEMKALTSVTCKSGNGGTELQAVARGGDEIVVLQMGFENGKTPDPMAREVVITVKVPLGVSIQVGE